jgi:hypothetical protein
MKALAGMKVVSEIFADADHGQGDFVAHDDRACFQIAALQTGVVRPSAMILMSE